MFSILESFTRGGLGVDGQRELVDDNNEEEDDGRDSGGQGDVPSLDGSPGLVVNNGSRGDGNSSTGASGASGGGLHGVSELAARSIDARVRVILEGTDNTDEDEEGNDDGDDDDSGKGNGNKASDGHSSSEDELVADAVKEEGEEEGQEDKSSQQSNEDKSLGGLDNVAHTGGQVVVAVCGLLVDAAEARVGGLLSGEIEVNLVGGLFGSGSSKGNSGSGGGGRSSGDLEGHLGLKLEPGGDSGGDHQSDDDRSKNDCTAVSRCERGHCWKRRRV
jgi:hypothetical protein